MSPIVTAVLLLLCGHSSALLADRLMLSHPILRASSRADPPAAPVLCRRMLPHSRRPPCCRAGRLVAQFQEEPAAGQFDPSSEQFDLLSLRSFRRDALLQYDATNQSEPLRIALTLLGILFALAYPSLLADTPGLQPADPTLTTAGSAFGAVGCAFLFQQNRAARASRIERISREYALGDLTATFRGVRTARLREMRGKLRFVILVGPSAAVAAALREAHVYRRRLTTASTAVVPVYSDGEPRGAPEACPAYLWTAAAPADWLAYYSELLQRRGLGAGGAAGECAWIGINMKGRTFGSALGKPRWDELLGTALSPAGDAFGEIAPAQTNVTAAAAEAVTAAATMRATGMMDAPPPILGSSVESRGQASGGIGAAAGGTAGGVGSPASRVESVLAAQAHFYEALTGGDLNAMWAMWEGSPSDPSVSQVVAAAGQLDPWASQLKESSRPAGMRATDCDALLFPDGCTLFPDGLFSDGDNGLFADGVAWTTTVERPAAGGTLLATQGWRWQAGGAGPEGGEWRLVVHRTIPWDAGGGTAVATLRCDCRGCVALARQINTREVAQRGG